MYKNNNSILSTSYTVPMGNLPAVNEQLPKSNMSLLSPMGKGKTPYAPT
jgi:hypothetical protein